MTTIRNHGDPVPKGTANLADEQLARLRELFPEAFTEGKVDWDRLRATLGDLVDDGPERYTFTWAGKRDAIRLLQTPTRATLVPCREGSVDFDQTQHLFIEGDNLEVLKLLYKPYFGRVKMIYIDPPYNTGNDFIYPDDYADPLATYLQLTGQQDAEGNLLTSNPETSGRYHSAWLSMMYPRLFLARQLLREDGVIFVSIDDHEVHNLGLLMNEVFGEENFMAQITWKKVYGGGAKVKHVVIQHEYVLCYARSKDAIDILELPPDPEARKRYTERDEKYHVRGPYFTQPLATTSMDFRPNLRFPIKWQGEEIWPEKQWQWSRDRVEQALADNELVFNKQDDGGWSVRYKQYLRDENGIERGSKLYSVLTGPYTQEGTAEVDQLLGDGKIFPFPKPSALIQHFISHTKDDENAIILDFFAGSCPTAQAVLEFNREYGGNRRFIMIQLPEPTLKETEAHEAGYRTIADIGKERIRRVIAGMQQANEGQLPLDTRETPEDLGFKVFKLAPSNYRPWAGVDDDTPDVYAGQMQLFTDPLVDGWTAENVIYEVALKEGYGLNCRIERIVGAQRAAPNVSTAIYRVTDPDKEQSFYICLDDAISLSDLGALNLGKDDLFICRDVALDDDTAANLALQCRLKTI
jgi:adenine-specific DNA-methyltransferase